MIKDELFTWSKVEYLDLSVMTSSRWALNSLREAWRKPQDSNSPDTAFPVNKHTHFTIYTVTNTHSKDHLTLIWKNMRGNQAKSHNSKIILLLRRNQRGAKQLQCVSVCYNDFSSDIQEQRRLPWIMSTHECIKAHFYNPSNFVKLEVLQKSTILWEIKVFGLEGQVCIWWLLELL